MKSTLTDFVNYYVSNADVNMTTILKIINTPHPSLYIQVAGLPAPMRCSGVQGGGNPECPQ